MNANILDPILALGFPPLVTETSIGLLDAWASRFAETDSRQTTLLVETPFVIELDEHALVVGIADRIAWSEEAQTIFDCSWKTTREPDTRGWHNETKWLVEQRRSAQWRIESLAMTHGRWIVNGERYLIKPQSQQPPVVVRGAVKSAIPAFWPTDESEGVWQLDGKQIESVWNALDNKVETIRRLRECDVLPWQLTGMQCVEFNRTCEFHDAYCAKGAWPVEGVGKRATKGHAAKGIEDAIALYETLRGKKYDDPLDVILSPSGYERASKCIEKWRIARLMDEAPGTPPQQIGQAFHAGLAAWYTNEMPLATGEERNRWLTKIK